ncbi:hypothetical protein BSKO_06065 [Bryopsis sp. KO-2023]|nr:hypothetical protein BSKO_06065 [Bryopsis sp. KO-2023]
MASKASSKSPVGRENKKRRAKSVAGSLEENVSPLKKPVALFDNKDPVPRGSGRDLFAKDPKEGKYQVFMDQAIEHLVAEDREKGRQALIEKQPEKKDAENEQGKKDGEENQATDGKKKMGTGSIELIVGPMFSGKTTALIDRIEVAEKGGRKVVAIKSSIDSRYAETEDYKSFIVCHSGGKVACYSVNKLSEFKKRFPEEYETCEVLAIDEAQFFSDLVGFCSEAADVDGKKVHVAGLDGDFRREPFKLMNRYHPISKLLPMCDKVMKKCAQCMYCENEAPFTFRTVADSREILVGGADSYVPVCRKHFMLKSKTPPNSP